MLIYYKMKQWLTAPVQLLSQRTCGGLGHYWRHYIRWLMCSAVHIWSRMFHISCTSSHGCILLLWFNCINCQGKIKCVRLFHIFSTSPLCLILKLWYLLIDTVRVHVCSLAHSDEELYEVHSHIVPQQLLLGAYQGDTLSLTDAPLLPALSRRLGNKVSAVRKLSIQRATLSICSFRHPQMRCHSWVYLPASLHH